MFSICDEFEAYGYRRVGAALRQQGVVVNHKKIRRLMREHDLRPRTRRRFVATTDSDHDGPIFPNLAKGFVPSGPNLLWVRDIPSRAADPLHLSCRHSRCLVASERRRFDRPGDRRVPDSRRLETAIAKPPAGCIHHSYRGSLGGFQRPSQHSEVGGCDEHSKAAIDTVLTSAITFTGTAPEHIRYWRAIAAGLSSDAALEPECRGL